MNLANQSGGMKQGSSSNGGTATAPDTGTHQTGWTCSCGQTGNTGKFCANCGSPKPAPATRSRQLGMQLRHLQHR